MNYDIKYRLDRDVQEEGDWGNMNRRLAPIWACIRGDSGYSSFRDELTPDWFFQTADPVAAPRKCGGRSCFQGAP